MEGKDTVTSRGVQCTAQSKPQGEYVLDLQGSLKLPKTRTRANSQLPQ